MIFLEKAQKRANHRTIRIENENKIMGVFPKNTAHNITTL
jgi:hypothetical protein